MWEDRNTNIESTAYDPHGTGMKVCVAVETNKTGTLRCACVPDSPSISGQIKRYLPSECPSNCNGSSGIWIPVQSGRCIRAASNDTGSAVVYCSQKECEQAAGNYALQ